MNVNGVGISQNTPRKQQDYEYILRVLLPIAKAAMAKNSAWAEKLFRYVDLNSGPGLYPGCDGKMITGSPLIFCRLAQALGLPYRATMIEIEEENCKKLEMSLWDNPNVEVVKADNENYLTLNLLEWSSWKWNGIHKPFGLFYSDPSGNVPPIEALARVSRVDYFDRMDILIHVSAARLKGATHSPATRYYMSLADSLMLVKKKVWLVREPVGAHQFSFCLGLNWDGMKSLKKIGFHRTDSPEGKEILKVLNFTREELAV